MYWSEQIKTLWKTFVFVIQFTADHPLFQLTEVGGVGVRRCYPALNGPIWIWITPQINVDSQVGTEHTVKQCCCHYISRQCSVFGLYARLFGTCVCVDVRRRPQLVRVIPTVVRRKWKTNICTQKPSACETKLCGLGWNADVSHSLSPSLTSPAPFWCVSTCAIGKIHSVSLCVHNLWQTGAAQIRVICEHKAIGRFASHDNNTCLLCPFVHVIGLNANIMQKNNVYR